MTARDLVTLPFDVATLTQGYASGAFSPADIVTEAYRRIAACPDPAVWITLRSKDELLADLATLPHGPLSGIPFAVKDNIDVAGLPTTCACPAYSREPRETATAVAKLQAAGAILIGKTNLDQFATGLNGTRSPYGAPVCAFNSAYISGGSSSGSAVAVSRGLVTFALGTDTAGSGRVPAGLNNIIGLKPTKGAVSTHGVVPACRSLDCVSIFSLTARDAHDVLMIAQGFDPHDPFSRRPVQPPPIPATWEGLRVGVPATDHAFFADSAAVDLFADAIARVRGLGADIVAFDFAPFAAAADLLYAGPWVAERFAAIEDFARAHAAEIIEPVRQIILGGETYSAVDAFRASYRLAELLQTADAAWQTMDVMLLPTAGPAYTIAEMKSDPIRLNTSLGATTNFVNLMDLAAVALPAGFRPSGVPYGVTLIGRAFTDGALARLADALHRALPDATLGATGAALGGAPAISPPAATDTAIHVAVVGAHLTGQPLHTQLVERRARLVRTARTAAGYSFYELAGTSPAKPGLVFDGRGTGRIEVEIFAMDAAAFGSFVALIPPPLGIGTLTLEDGSRVKGFVCESHGLQGARDITAYGGWRAWLAAPEQR